MELFAKIISDLKPSTTFSKLDLRYLTKLWIQLYIWQLSDRLRLMSQRTYGAPLRPKFEIYFFDERWRFYYEWSRFLWWPIEIFIIISRDFVMIGRDFNDDKSRFSTWQIQNCLLLRLNSRSARVASHHLAFMGNCLTIRHMC